MSSKEGLELELLAQSLAVCKLSSSSSIPVWALRSSFYSISKTSDELSIVCDQVDVPLIDHIERDWRCLKVKGLLDFGLTGILASLAKPLAEAGISIFAISTFNTDYLLIKQKDLELAKNTLVKAGHRF